MNKIPPESNLQKLKVARDKLADVYQSEATDDLHDNGNLTAINSAILRVDDAIKTLEERS